ncbi:MAG TPA: hypothetical protein VFU36_02005 [Jatrophihabitans sp.]|nr:hypothetical protein [Jatrophihabitans sp.]
MQILILLLLVAALALLVLALVGANSALAACSIALSLVAVAMIVRGRQRRTELARARAAEAERLARIEAQQDEATRVLAAAAAEAGRRAAAAPAEPVGLAAEPVAAEPITVAAEPVAVAEPLAPAAEPVPTASPDAATTGSWRVESAAARGTPVTLEAAAQKATEFAVPSGYDISTATAPGEPAAASTMPPLDRHGRARVWVIDGRPRYHLVECRHLDGTAEPISLNQAVEDGFTPCADCDPDNRITG